MNQYYLLETLGMDLHVTNLFDVTVFHVRGYSYTQSHQEHSQPLTQN